MSGEVPPSFNDASVSDHALMKHYLRTFSQPQTIDKSSFISFVNEIPPSRTSLIGRILVSLCLAGHKDCVHSLLIGETLHSVDVNLVTPSGVTALLASASRCDPHITQMLLHQGADADVRAAPPHQDYNGEDGYRFDGSIGILPLEAALSWGGSQGATTWTEKDVAGLIVYCCRPEKEDSLETIRLLAQSTKQFGRVLSRCVAEGNAFNLAILLVVAREKVMSSLIFGNRGSSHSKGMQIKEFIMTKIAELSEELAFMVDERNDLLSEKLEMKSDLMFALLLLQVFEKAGERLDEYLKTKTNNAGSYNVPKEFHAVTSLLQEVGCDVTETMRNIQAKCEKNEEYNLHLMDPRVSLFSQLDGSSHDHTQQQPNVSVQNQQRRSYSTCLPYRLAVSSSPCYMFTSHVGKVSQTNSSFTSCLSERAQARERTSVISPFTSHRVLNRLVSLLPAFKRVVR